MKIALVVLSLMLATIAVADTSNVLFVDTDSGDDTNACTMAAPCKTIMAALAKVDQNTKAIVWNGRQFRCANGDCNIPPLP